MAIAIDHKTIQSAGSGVNITIPSSTGNLIVVLGQPGTGPPNDITAINDDKGNVYVKAGPQSNGVPFSQSCWYAKNATTGVTTVTPTFPGGGGGTFAVYDCSGADTNNPLTAYASWSFANKPSTANPQGPQVNVADGGGVVMASVLASAFTAVNAIASPFTLDSSGGAGTGFGSTTNASAGSFLPSWTLGASDGWTGQTVAFKSVAGVPLLLVQQQGVASTPTTIAPTTVGNLIVVSLALSGTSSGTVTSVTDNAPGGTNIYVQAPNARATDTGGSFVTDIWYCKNCKAGATSVTVNSASSVAAVAVYEFSGADTNNPFDTANHADNQTAGTTGNHTMPNPSLTTNFAKEILVSAIANGGNIIDIENPFANYQAFVGAVQIVTALGTYNATFDSNTSGDVYCAGLAGFTTPSSGPTSGGQGFGSAILDEYVWLGGDQE